MKLPKETDINLIGEHLPAVWLVNEIFRQQSQPLNMIAIDEAGFTVSLRTNLQNVQFERLILAPLNEMLNGYTVNADFKNRALEIKRDAVPAKRSRPAKDSGQASD